MSMPAEVDPLYPSSHPRPPSNWVNDPNGLVHHNGRWHLFAQANPAGTRSNEICWWHADSADLVHWTDRGIALRPHVGDDSRADRDGMWSGNAVSHNGELVAFYSAFRTDTAWQPALRAVSSDDGASFADDGTVLATAPEVVVLPDGTRTTAHTLRDPFVWRDGDGWSLILGAGVDVVDSGDGPDRYAAVLRFASNDLATWTYAGVFHHLPAPAEHAAPELPDTGEMWECPAYAELSDDAGDVVSLLIVCGWYRTSFPARAIALLAARDGDTLTQRSSAFLDDGDAMYAPSLLHAPDGRILLWGWVRETRDQSESDAVGWTGALTFPRELTLRNGEVASWPVAELDALRIAEVPVAADGFDLPLSSEILLSGGTSPVTAELISGDTTLLLSLDGDRATVGDVTLAADATTADGASRPWVRVFVDGSVVEVFTSAGRAATIRVYPSDHRGWTVRVDGPTNSLQAWSLDRSALTR